MSAPYDSFDYLSYWKGRNFEDNCERCVLKKIFEKLKKKSFLVDIGGGFGRLASLYSPIFERCLIIEPSQNLIKIGKDLNKDFKNVEFKQGSLPRLPIKDSSVDVALMVRVFHHFDDSVAVIKEVSRIVKPGGFFVLEFANKIHFIARLRAVFSLNFRFAEDQKPIDRRSEKSKKEGKIFFMGHHPKKIIEDLERSNFEIKEIFSVSNLRNPLIKKIFPEKFLLWVEDSLQKQLGKLFFGPSIFILAEKKN